MPNFQRVFWCLAVALPPMVATASEPVTIVCLGDSVTKAVREGVLPDQTFCTLLERSLSTPERLVEVVNAGIGGNTTADGWARLERDVLAHRPRYVVLMFGLNDSWIDEGRTASRVSVSAYRENLAKMIAAIRDRGATVVLMTPNPAIAPKYPAERNVTLKPYVDAVRDLAREEKLELVDVYSRFAELAVEGVDLNSQFTDAMHPNPAGQKLIAELLTTRLRPLIEQNAK
jgi:acyl-CoA thioesterase-1